jgi:chromosome segregation ATPase
LFLNAPSSLSEDQGTQPRDFPIQNSYRRTWTRRTESTNAVEKRTTVKDNLKTRNPDQVIEHSPEGSHVLSRSGTDLETSVDDHVRLGLDPAGLLQSSTTSKQDSKQKSRHVSPGGVSKSAKEASLKNQHSVQQEPTVARALAILQWAWFEEKSALETTKVTEIKAMEQKLVKSNQDCAVLEESVRNSRSNEADLLARLDYERQNKQAILKKVGESRKFLSGLAHDLEKERLLASNARDQCNSLKNELKEISMGTKTAQESISSSRKRHRDLEEKYRILVQDLSASVDKLNQENIELERSVDQKSRFLEVEQHARARLEQELLDKPKLDDTLRSLLAKTDDILDHRFAKLEQDIKKGSAETEPNRLDELLDLLKEMRAQPIEGTVDLKQLKILLKDTEARYGKANKMAIT